MYMYDLFKPMNNLYVNFHKFDNVMREFSLCPE